MQFSENWLRTLTDPSISSDELAHLLTMSGLEVEEVEPVAPPFSKVVVAQVIEVAKHPNADRLNVCQVDAGTGTLLNIVCGASNVRPGLKVACAMAGAVLEAAQRGKLVVVDGFISSAAVLVAQALAPGVTKNCVFSHRSGECGHGLMLRHLGPDEGTPARALLDLELRLGEGSGAALAWPLLVSACALLREMASFESAGVSRTT